MDIGEGKDHEEEHRDIEKGEGKDHEEEHRDIGEGKDHEEEHTVQTFNFLHQSTGRLPVPDCTNTHGKHIQKYPKHISDLNVACSSKLRSVLR